MYVLTKDNFETDNQGLTVVDFWNEGCTKCLAIMPDIEALEAAYGDKIKFCKLDTKASGPRFNIKLKVMGLPAIIVYKDGVELERVAGPDVDKAAVEAMLKKHI